MNRGTYSGKILIGSILAGIIYALIGEIFYKALEPVVPGVLLVAIYFVGLFLFLGFAIWGLSRFVYSRFYRPIDFKQWIRIFCLMMVGSVLFEFLYELHFPGKNQLSDSYIFVLDNSGSMLQSDPEGIRFDAVENLLSTKDDDFKYAVYTFSDDVILARNMDSKSAGLEYDRGENYGGTAILKTLQTILTDIEEGRLVLDGGQTHMILLSDGYATDIDFFTKNRCISALKKYAKQDITISTVGLLNADEDLMSLIATKTGGAFINVEDVEHLDEAMLKAGETGDNKWNLLGYRNDLKADIVYALMRMVFITLLGALIGLQKAVVCEKFLDTSEVIRSSMIGSALAGVCIEIGMNMFGVHPTIVRILVCALISFTLLKCDFEGMRGRDAEVYRGI